MAFDLSYDFYKEEVFNLINSDEKFISAIRNQNQILEYKDLHKLLTKRKKFFQKSLINQIIEFGCGTGWLTNSIAYHYGKNVKGVDYTVKAIEIAEKISRKIKLKNQFERSNLFTYKDNKEYDLVISIGCLHHTNDCKAAFKKICSFVKKGGYVYIGLYHLYSRNPMLSYLRSHAYWYGNESAYNIFKRMNLNMENPEHNYSWFRDQVFHPQETQHTLKEVKSWLDELSLELVSTSINNYQSLKNINMKELYNSEKKLEKVSYEKNRFKHEFFPGFFTICAKNN